MIGPPLKAMEPDAYTEHRARPAVSNADEAMQLADAGPVLCVDTGMQRFACPPERLAEVMRAGAITEAYSRATSNRAGGEARRADRGPGIKRGGTRPGRRCWENRPRGSTQFSPGMALYRGTARITSRLLRCASRTGQSAIRGGQVRRASTA